MDNKIKVLFQSRVDLFKKRGGDTYQVEHTKKAIENIYPEFQIDIDLSIKSKDIEKYDIVNLFNLDWICETYPQAINAKKHDKKVVLSAIHHPVDKILLYEREYQFGIRRITNTLIKNQNTLDALKNIYRSLYFPAKVIPTIEQTMMGAYSQQKKVVELSDAILVQTYKEKEDLINRYHCDENKYHRIVLGVDSQVFMNSSPDKIVSFLKNKNIDISNKQVILSVGRVEPRKNQLTLIEAFTALKLKDPSFKEHMLLFIGELNSYHPEYLKRFNKLVKKRTDILHLGKLPQELVASAMRLDGIYVQPSWFETFGLTNIEAYISGMKIVTSIERIREFFGDKIIYCEPNRVESVVEAILKTRNLPDPSNEEITNLANILNWKQTAHQTVAVYKELLNKK